MTTAQDVVNIATAELGYGEINNTNNISKFTIWYGVNGPWCAMFVSYVFNRAGMKLQIDTPKGFAYCPSGVAWFKKNPPWQWVDKDESPKVGDIVFYDWYPNTTDSDAWHVGIVVSVTNSGQVTCIDGNFGSYPAKVARHNHSMSTVYGYARPPYDGVSVVGRIIPWPERYFSLTSPNMQGQDILIWQQKMIASGFSLGSSGPSGHGDDGEFGPLSYKAAKEFQKQNGLKEDGIIGPETWAKLFKES